MISENEAELRVQLRLPQTTCKARDRREAGGLVADNSDYVFEPPRFCRWIMRFVEWL